MSLIKHCTRIQGHQFFFGSSRHTYNSKQQKHEITMVKSRKNKTTMVKLRYNFSMVFPISYHLGYVIQYFLLRTFGFSSSRLRLFTIALSFLCIFTIVHCTFHPPGFMFPTFCFQQYAGEKS
jgi:hypothetical protein